MSKKTALVVGGAGGIGSEICRQLLKNDMAVCCADIVEPKQERGLKYYHMDLASEASVKAAVDGIIKDFAKIEVIVYAATISVRNTPALNMQWSQIAAHIDIQTRGFFTIVQSLKDQIKARHRTRFVAVLTEYCLGTPPSGVSDYVTAKYSLLGLCKAMAVELARYDCRVNMVSPGMVDTSLISGLPAKLIEMTALKNPLKRIASAKDVAGVVSFLVDEASDYLNGVNIPVNGGGLMP